MPISCVQNRNMSLCISASDYSVQSPQLCSLILISILIQLPAAVGGSEAALMLDSAMT
jgi:hypothetical protein